MDDEMIKYVEKERERRKKEELAFLEEMNSRENELSKYREMLKLRETELDQFKDQLRKEQLEKEKLLNRELKERDQIIEARERDLYERQRKMEEKYQARHSETEKIKLKLESELAKKEAELNNLFQEVEKEKERYTEESRKSIESKSRKFVDAALQSLEKKECGFHRISKTWATIGAISIALGIAFAIFSMLYSADAYHQTGNNAISYYLYSLFRGLIVVGLFGLLSRYAFIFSNSYMHESLKSGERLHAIKFGEFYLDAYGADADWAQIKEAFEHWNISGQSAFSKRDTANSNDLVETLSKLVEKTINTKINLGSNGKSL